MGSVYFVRARKAQRIKIGFSADVTQRLAQLQTGCAEPLELLAVIPDCSISTESALHAAFVPFREQGEWFRYVGALYMFVQAVKAGARPKTMQDIAILREFSTSSHVLKAAKAVIADPSSTHEQLREAHVAVRHLTSRKFHL